MMFNKNRSMISRLHSKLLFSASELHRVGDRVYLMTTDRDSIFDGGIDRNFHEIGAYRKALKALEHRYPGHYMVFHLAEECISGDIFDASTLLKFRHESFRDVMPMPPLLDSLIGLCRTSRSWLQSSHENVVVISCPLVQASLIVSCVLHHVDCKFDSEVSILYARFVKTFQSICSPGTALPTAHVRFLHDWWRLLAETRCNPERLFFTLSRAGTLLIKRVDIHCVPNIAGKKQPIRLFVMVTSGCDVMYTSMLKYPGGLECSIDDPMISFTDINAKACGDCILKMYRMQRCRPGGHLLLSFPMHTSFAKPVRNGEYAATMNGQETSHRRRSIYSIHKEELDDIARPCKEYFGSFSSRFRIDVHVEHPEAEQDAEVEITSCEEKKNAKCSLPSSPIKQEYIAQENQDLLGDSADLELALALQAVFDRENEDRGAMRSDPDINIDIDLESDEGVLSTKSEEIAAIEYINNSGVAVSPLTVNNDTVKTEVEMTITDEARDESSSAVEMTEAELLEIVAMHERKSEARDLAMAHDLQNQFEREALDTDISLYRDSDHSRNESDDEYDSVAPPTNSLPQLVLDAEARILHVGDATIIRRSTDPPANMATPHRWSNGSISMEVEAEEESLSEETQSLADEASTGHLFRQYYQRAGNGWTDSNPASPFLPAMTQDDDAIAAAASSERHRISHAVYGHYHHGLYSNSSINVALVNSLPICTLTIVDSAVVDGRECLICRYAFVAEDVTKTLPCIHTFHDECVTPWLYMKGTCPVCLTHIRHALSNKFD